MGNALVCHMKGLVVIIDYIIPHTESGTNTSSEGKKLSALKDCSEEYDRFYQSLYNENCPTRSEVSHSLLMKLKIAALYTDDTAEKLNLRLDMISALNFSSSYEQEKDFLFSCLEEALRLEEKLSTDPGMDSLRARTLKTAAVLYHYHANSYPPTKPDEAKTSQKNYEKIRERLAGRPEEKETATLIDAIQGTWVNRNAPHDKKPHREEKVAIVVLGGGFDKKTGKILEHVIERLKAGKRVAQINPDWPIILTGGNPYKGKISEGEAMGNWLQEHWGPKAKNPLWIERKARNTVENAEDAFLLIDRQDKNVNHVVVVSSEFHLFRAHTIFSMNHRKKPSTVVTAYASDPQGHPKDVSSLMFYIHTETLRSSGVFAFQSGPFLRQ